MEGWTMLLRINNYHQLVLFTVCFCSYSLIHFDLFNAFGRHLRKEQEDFGNSSDVIIINSSIGLLDPIIHTILQGFKKFLVKPLAVIRPGHLCTPCQPILGH